MWRTSCTTYRNRKRMWRFQAIFDSKAINWCVVSERSYTNYAMGMSSSRTRTLASSFIYQSANVHLPLLAQLALAEQFVGVDNGNGCRKSLKIVVIKAFATTQIIYIHSSFLCSAQKHYAQNTCYSWMVTIWMWARANADCDDGSESVCVCVWHVIGRTGWLWLK